MSTQTELLREAVELLRALADHNVTYWSDDGEARFNPGKNQADSMRIFREARDFLAKIDAAEGEVPEGFVLWADPDHIAAAMSSPDPMIHAYVRKLPVSGDRLQPFVLAASGRQDGAR